MGKRHTIVVIGRVTCLKQYYADGVEHRSIEIDKNQAAGLPYKIGRRVQVNLVVGGQHYSAGLRATKRNKTVWISPDLFHGTGKKIRLADVISQYRCNQNIEIESQREAVRILTPPGVDAPKAQQAPRISKPSTVSSIRRASTHRAGHSARSHARRFVASRLGPYLLEPKIAERAIRNYNLDPVLLSQEQSAFQSIGQGFRQGALESQLRGLNAAYSTRSSLHDLAVIAAALESQWHRWKSLLAGIQRLEIAVPDAGRIAELLGFFLEQDTQRTPRSLATKAMHFARPMTFIAVDTYAADKIGDELCAGSWADTSGLDAAEMAVWYGDYLTLIHKVGAENEKLIARLLRIDERTAPEAWSNRLRGLPKLLDKILWWAGREERRGNRASIFLP